MKAIQATKKKKETWCLSAVNFGRRDSDKLCVKGTSFEGVGDSCTEWKNAWNRHDIMWIIFDGSIEAKCFLQIQASGQHEE